MDARYVGATLIYTDTCSACAVREREELAKEFMMDMSARPDDLVVLFEDEMPKDRSRNGGYG